jgi:RNA polymerase sigma-70 factor (ECF subfamily)
VSEPLEQLAREQWWSAVAAVMRLTGDLGVAEDAVQEAYAAAVVSWPAEGVPSSPFGWLVTVARRRAIDELRRQSRRRGKELAAMREFSEEASARVEPAADPEDELSLIFMCCHPALDPSVRVALTLRCVAGLTTAQIAAAFLVPEPTMAKRLVRAKAKIRQARIPFRVPAVEELGDRLASVLRVIYLIFTEGHTASSGPALVRGDLCDTALRLARSLADRLPGEPEVAGLLALLLLIDARRAARVDDLGALVLLDEQDRSLWNQQMIAEGDAILEQALSQGRPGPYQLHAAISACHSTAATAGDTDWRQIALLYGELIRHEPTPVIEANRAVALAMAEGPAAGLVILDAVAHHPQLANWYQLRIARAELLRRAGRLAEATRAFHAALELEPPAAERSFITRRLVELAAD